MRVTVVISYYNARSPQPLIGLLESMQTHEPGCIYDTCIVVNRAIDQDLVLPAALSHHSILYRPNTGFNISAWEHGWRSCPDADFFLFLQDDCVVHRDNWLKAYVQASKKPRIGLVGELINWNRYWEQLNGKRILEIVTKDHTLNGNPATRKEVYFDAFHRWNIDPGLRADHLQSLIWAARRETLETIHGFPASTNYGEAIAAEIATSKKIQSAGYRIRQVHWRPFHYVRHPQWPYNQSIITLVLGRIRDSILRNSWLHKISLWLFKLLRDIKAIFSSVLLKAVFTWNSFWEERITFEKVPSTTAPEESDSPLYRVLFVDDNLPDPRIGAGYTRAKAFLSELIEAGCTVDHYSLASKSPKELESFQSFQKQHPGPRFLSGSGLRGLRSLRLTSSHAYDLIIVSRGTTLDAMIQTGWLKSEPQKRPYRVVYDSEAITSVRKQLRIKLYPFTLRERIFSMLKPDEWSQTSRVDMMAMVTEHDASLVRQHVAKSAVVVSYPVEVRENLPKFDQRRDFLFIGRLAGSIRSTPNVDGLHWFLTKVLPLLQQSDLPEFKIHVVGQVSSLDLLALSSDTVRFYDKVDELTAFFDAARVFIAPVRYAAGIPIKVLDAITNGVPAVATPILRYQLGLDDTYPQSFPDPADFARECIRLYSDRQQWEAERSIQRDLAESRYSSTEFRRSIRNLLESVWPDQGQDESAPGASSHPTGSISNIIL